MLDFTVNCIYLHMDLFFFPRDTFGTPFYNILKEKTDETSPVVVCEFFSEYMFSLQLLSINSGELFPLNKNNFFPLTKQHNFTNISAISSLSVSPAAVTMQWLPIVMNCITKGLFPIIKFSH